jgi:hypothetical protein
MMSNTISKPETQLADLRPYLLSGENIQWTGRPKQGVAFSGFDVFFVPFSLFWLGMVIWMFWGIGKLTLRSSEAFPFPAMQILFLTVGTYGFLGRFIVDALHRKSLVYAITDQRVLIVSRFPLFRVTSLARKPELPITMAQHRNGSGTLSFGGAKSWASSFNGFDGWHACLGQGPQFYCIADVIEVFRMLQPVASRER